MTRRPKRSVAEFDSATAMLTATARAMRGESFPRLGRGRVAASAVLVSQQLPERWRQVAYAVGGALEGVPAGRLGEVDLEAVAGWAADHYPSRRYPAVAIGSSNGAAVHLFAALGIPWLPQTFLIPVRHRADPDDARAVMEFGARVAEPLLARNPAIALHHMLDPNQDRLMSRLMAYFRVKWLRLPDAYRRFLDDTLAPGAPLLIVRDRSGWPVTRLGERHVFQFGAQGGISAQEYHVGSPRVAALLQGRRWDPPSPNETAPEAEWGFAPPLLTDIQRWAATNGHPLKELVLDCPEDLSAPVAEIYRDWYRELGRPTDRLLVETFVMLDAVTAIRAGCIPFWTLFNVEPSLQRVARYLDDATYADISVGLFPHGVQSAGIAMPDRWREQLRRATRGGRFVALDEKRYPADLAGLARYQRALAKLYPQLPLPEESLPLSVVDALFRDLPVEQERPGHLGDDLRSAVEGGMPQARQPD